MFVSLNYTGQAVCVPSQKVTQVMLWGMGISCPTDYTWPWRRHIAVLQLTRRRAVSTAGPRISSTSLCLAEGLGSLFHSPLPSHPEQQVTGIGLLGGCLISSPCSGASVTWCSCLAAGSSGCDQEAHPHRAHGWTDAFRSAEPAAPLVRADPLFVLSGLCQWTEQAPCSGF